MSLYNRTTLQNVERERDALRKQVGRMRRFVEMSRDFRTPKLPNFYEKYKDVILDHKYTGDAMHVEACKILESIEFPSPSPCPTCETLVTALDNIPRFELDSENGLLYPKVEGKWCTIAGVKVALASLSSPAPEKTPAVSNNVVRDAVRKFSCTHDHLNMEGICHKCGQDCRGIGDGLPTETPAVEDEGGKTPDPEDADRLQASLESVLTWAEDAIAFKRNILKQKHANEILARTKAWLPGTRADLQPYNGLEERIARELEEFEKWKQPITEANKLLDLFLKNDASPSLPSLSATPEKWTREGTTVFGLNDDGTGISFDSEETAELVASAPFEKRRRLYYQSIVYHVCSTLDRITGRSVSRGTGIVCGTADSPTTEVQDAVKALEEKILIYIPQRELNSPSSTKEGEPR